MMLTPASILPTARLISDDTLGTTPAPAPEKWDRHPVKLAIGNLISPFLDKRIKGPSLGRLVQMLFSLSIVNKANIADLASGSTNISWKKFVAEVGGADRRELYENIRQLLLLTIMPRILNSTVENLNQLIRSILYIGPARAKSDRYYRYQDLAVSEIDPGAENFPMFLNSLSEDSMLSFSDWVRNLFGYGVSVGRESGHITINLVHDTGTVNVVDTGYGVSQILPVLGQVWWANNKPRPARFTSALILAIEQPELHLHPAHQALLADAFVSGLQLTGADQSAKEDTTHFILETHSETMINRLGALIAEKKISPNLIQILIFDAGDADSGKTSVKQVVFDDEGQLVDWPYNFFLPSS